MKESVDVVGILPRVVVHDDKNHLEWISKSFRTLVTRDPEVDGRVVSRFGGCSGTGGLSKRLHVSLLQEPGVDLLRPTCPTGRYTFRTRYRTHETEGVDSEGRRTTDKSSTSGRKSRRRKEVLKEGEGRVSETSVGQGCPNVLKFRRRRPSSL